MKTFTLLVSIFIAQVSGSASPAAVAFHNHALKPGYNLISNPLIATDNSIGALFQRFNGNVPDGTTVYKYVNGNFVIATWLEMERRFLPEDAANTTLLPGEGAFVYIPGPTERVITFVGEVPMGNLCVTIPSGFSIVSAPVPFALNAAQTLFIFPPAPLRTLTMYRYNPALRNYTTYSYIPQLFAEWMPALPVLAAGEAVWVHNSGPAYNSCNTYEVLTP